MANKDRNKRSVRKARAEERARVQAAQAVSASSAKKDAPKKSEKSSAKSVKAPAKAEKKETKKSDKKPGIIKRFRNYLGDVRSEMRRVVWPSPEELKSYSIAIIIMLIVFGVLLWLVDSGIVAALVGYTGLRG